MNIRFMIAPGKSYSWTELPSGLTVLGLAEHANNNNFDNNVNFVEIVSNLGIRVNNRPFSSNESVGDDQAGSILSTTLNDGDVIIAMGKIKGNNNRCPLLTCTVNDQEYCSDSPIEVGNMLTEIVGMSLDGITIKINGEDAQPNQWLCPGDVVTTSGGARNSDDELVSFGRLKEGVSIVDLEDDIGSLLEENDEEVGEREAILHNGQFVEPGDYDNIELEAGDSVIIVPVSKTGKRASLVIR